MSPGLHPQEWISVASGQHGTLLVSEKMIVVSNPGPSLNFSSACAPTLVLSMMRQAHAEAMFSSLQNHRLNKPSVFINYLASINLVTRTESYKDSLCVSCQALVTTVMLVVQTHFLFVL